MRTKHKIIFGDSRSMNDINDNSIHLVVTSPPYPMINIWDDLFFQLSDKIREKMDFLEKNKNRLSEKRIINIAYEVFDEMHKVLLEPVWEQLSRILVDGAIVCINIGDALRKIGDIFFLFPNHIKIMEVFKKLGFVSLPYILWKKPTNKPNAFLGSGFLPPNAYVTLDVEYILIFRKGRPRKFPPKYKLRYESKYSKEERDKWFSQIWDDIKGEKQNVNKLHRKTTSFPVEIPRRLIKMFSIKGDVVLDPFLGLGTTTIAAIETYRNSIGYELDKRLKDFIVNRLKIYSSVADIEIIENNQLLTLSLFSHKKL